MVNRRVFFYLSFTKLEFVYSPAFVTLYTVGTSRLWTGLFVNVTVCVTLKSIHYTKAQSQLNWVTNKQHAVTYSL